MARRTFNANPPAGIDRCSADRKPLRDGTAAQCMRRAVIDGLCRQHAGKVKPKVIDLMEALKASLAASQSVAPTETTHGLRPRDDHAWMLSDREG